MNNFLRIIKPYLPEKKSVASLSSQNEMVLNQFFLEIQTLIVEYNILITFYLTLILNSLLLKIVQTVLFSYNT